MAVVYEPIPVAHTEFSSETSTGGSTNAKFAIFLYKPQRIDHPLKLQIRLRVNMRQLPATPLPLTKDAGGEPYWTRVWSGPDWQQFLASAARQANMWNNKFWLVPPDTFDGFDVFVGGNVWRPNIRCELSVDFNASEDAHTTIDVANLNLAFITGPRDGGTFRTHSVLYDSLDGVPWVNSVSGETKYTIAHEIGHSIGLHHIGSILKTPLCQFAVAADAAGLEHPLTSGGLNSWYCYGHSQGRIFGNIMGAGNNFTAENALPWLWSIRMITGGPFQHWKAVTADPGPGVWLVKLTDRNVNHTPDQKGQRNDALVLQADALFGFGEDIIKAGAAAELTKIGNKLKSLPGWRILIEGHTDSKGSLAFNQDLSERRAKAVKKWLVTNGFIKEGDVNVRGFGKTRPVQPNNLPNGADNPAGREKNRRVEVVLLHPKAAT